MGCYNYVYKQKEVAFLLCRMFHSTTQDLFINETVAATRTSTDKLARQNLEEKVISFEETGIFGSKHRYRPLDSSVVTCERVICHFYDL